MHIRSALAVTALVVAVGIGPAAQTKPIVLRFGGIVTGTGQVIRDGVIVVEGDRIKAVGPARMPVPAGATIRDMRSLTAIPGLIDTHTHMTYVWDHAPGTTPLKQAAREPAKTVELAALNLANTLATGVTTVRDLGASRGLDYTLRDGVAAGKLKGPRMFVAGSGISGGRGGGPAIGDIPGLVDTRIKAGSDWIKVYASRGSYQSVDTTQTMTYEQLKAIVDAAHAQKIPVAIHSYGASGVKDAVRAGADSVEHGIELDDETLAMMKKQGTVWVPTIDHNRYYVDSKDEYGFAPETIPPLNDYIQKNFESTKRAFKAGVAIAMGSDAVYTGFGQNTRELGWFVKAGMTPAQALATATTIPAKMLRREKELGAIAPGYFADIVGVEGDPLKDIDVVINKVKFVMYAGNISEGATATAAQAAARTSAPQSPYLEETIPPGANFDKAEFKFFAPDTATLKGIVVLVPGSNGDGRPMAEDAFWQEFAKKNAVALLGCRFTDKPHDQSFIEDYVNVSRGSGQALLDVIVKFAARAKHPEVASAPLFLWGMSAGGQFNYEFTAWKPERVGAFIVNKGGIYYSALLSKAAREVPGLLFVGGTDLQSRIDTITGLFAVNRRGGAIWALVVEPGLGHAVGKSKEFGALFFEEMLAKPKGAGFTGDLKTFEFQTAATPGTPSTPNAWLQNERIANAWKAVVTGK